MQHTVRLVYSKKRVKWEQIPAQPDLHHILQQELVSPLQADFLMSPSD